MTEKYEILEQKRLEESLIETGIQKYVKIAVTNIFYAKSILYSER